MIFLVGLRYSVGFGLGVLLLALVLAGCSGEEVGNQASPSPSPSPSAVQPSSPPQASSSVAAVTPSPAVQSASPSGPEGFRVSTPEKAIAFAKQDVRIVKWMQVHVNSNISDPTTLEFQYPYWVFVYTENPCSLITPTPTVCSITAKMDASDGKVVEAVLS